jgi:hypothetical protein
MMVYVLADVVQRRIAPDMFVQVSDKVYTRCDTAGSTAYVGQQKGEGGYSRVETWTKKHGSRRPFQGFQGNHQDLVVELEHESPALQGMSAPATSGHQSTSKFFFLAHHPDCPAL